MAAGTVTDRPGTKAKVRHVRMSASKARVVLNLIRGKRVTEAIEILEFTERLAAQPIAKCLNSAVANAEHNDDLSADELIVSACFADEGPTLKRFRPRARGRAGRIHKQTCHITIEVARLTEEELDAERKRQELKDEGRAKRSSKRSGGGADRARRVAKSRAATDADEASADEADDQVAEDQVEEAAAEATDEVVAEDAASDDAGEETADETDADEPAAEGTTDEVAADEATSDDAGEKN